MGFLGCGAEACQLGFERVMSGIHHFLEWLEGFHHGTASSMAWAKPTLRMSASSKVEAASAQAALVIGSLAMVA